MKNTLHEDEGQQNLVCSKSNFYSKNLGDKNCLRFGYAPMTTNELTSGTVMKVNDFFKLVCKTCTSAYLVDQ